MVAKEQTYVSRWFRNLVTGIAVAAVVAIIAVVVTAEALTDQTYSPLWPLLIGLMLVCCMVAVGAWMLPLQPGENGSRVWGRKMREVGTDSWPIVRRSLPEPLAEGSLYQSPRPVYAVAPVPRREPASAVHTVPNVLARPVVVAEPEGDLDGLGLYLGGHAAGAHPEGDDGQRPDVEHLRGFADGAVDHGRREDDEETN